MKESTHFFFIAMPLAAFAAVFDFFPVALPLFSPGKRSAAYDADFGGQVALGGHFR
jgi:hypothetical protein